MNTTSGIGLSGLLGVAFIVLKLTEVIAWSWWWVLSPFWIPIIIILVIWIVVIALLVIRD